jgi:hypothetical protein
VACCDVIRANRADELPPQDAEAKMSKSASSDRRRFPRAREEIPVLVTISQEGREFEATVKTVDISLTGVFFASEFFLKAGTELNLEFTMPNDKRVVRVTGIIVREVRLDERRRGPGESGFAVRFTQYHADAKTILAGSFLIAELDEFVHDYLERRTAKPRTEIEQLRDVIIAWEVGKMELKGGELDLMRDRITVDGEGRIRRYTGEEDDEPNGDGLRRS